MASQGAETTLHVQFSPHKGNSYERVITALASGRGSFVDERENTFILLIFRIYLVSLNDCKWLCLEVQTTCIAAKANAVKAQICPF